MLQLDRWVNEVDGQQGLDFQDFIECNLKLQIM